MTSAAALALAVALAPAQSGPVTLKWNFKEGEVFYAKSVVGMDMTIGVMGQSIDQKMEMTTVVRYKVKSAKPGATVVEMAYLDMRMDAKGLPAGAAGFTEKLKGVTFTATLDDKLEVTKLEGYDKFLDALGGDDADQRKLFKTMLPEASVRQTVGQTFAIAPGKPVAVGESWTRSDKMAMGPLGNAAMKSTFKLQSVDDGIAKVDQKVDMSFKPGDGADGGLPFKITKFDMKADKFGGINLFDLKAGRLKEANVDGVMSGSMTASVGGQELEMTLKMKMKGKTTVTEKNPVQD